MIEPHNVLSPLPKQLPVVKDELGVEKSVKSANVSLDNLVTGKRRSKPVKSVKKQTKKHARKGEN